MPEQEQHGYTPEVSEMPTQPAPQVVHTAPAPARNPLMVPAAIVLGALLIAGAIVYTGTMKSSGTQVANVKDTTQETAEIEVAPVTEKDHIRGNPNAPIVIVEYSDFDCPFCKNFHETMNKIMAEYGKSGKVAWVYRQFPLEQLHPNAPKIAEASECVASIGGNDAFWKFADLVFGEREINAQTDVTKLPSFAERSGVSKEAYNRCMEAGTFKQKIQDDIEAAAKTGARGTPYSILIAGSQQGPINGAQPYATVKKMIDTILTQMEGGDAPKAN